MTDNEILVASNYVRCEDVITALITISLDCVSDSYAKRGIYSKPIKAYIDSLILKVRKKPVHERYYQSAMSYHLTQQTFTYGQKTPLSVDVEV